MNEPLIHHGLIMIEKARVDAAMSMAAVGKMALATLAAMSMKPWKQSTKDSHMMETLESIRDGLKAEVAAALEDENFTALITFGFQLMEDGPLLIPLWYWPMVPDGTELEDVSGEIIVKGDGQEICLDTHYGCMRYGYPRRRVLS